MAGDPPVAAMGNSSRPISSLYITLDSRVLSRSEESDDDPSKSQKLVKKKKNRRGGFTRKRESNHKNPGFLNFSLMGTNANGISSKLDSLQENINIFSPTVITIQETKLRRKGSILVPGFQVYESLRSENTGGGLLTAEDVNLDSAVVPSDNGNDDILTGQIRVGNLDLRVINAYGPQESCNNDASSFWQLLESEIISVKDNNCLLIIQLDANAKVGKAVIEDDPNEASKNGLTLLDMVTRHDLSIINSLDTCEGVVTRERKIINGVEKSVLDYIITCNDMNDFMEKMIINEDRRIALTRFLNSKTKKPIKSDHNLLYCTFKIKYESLKPTLRREVF